MEGCSGEGASISRKKESTVAGKAISIWRIVSFAEWINTNTLTIAEIKTWIALDALIKFIVYLFAKIGRNFGRIDFIDIFYFLNFIYFLEFIYSIYLVYLIYSIYFLDFICFIYFLYVLFLRLRWFQRIRLLEIVQFLIWRDFYFFDDTLMAN